MMFTPIRVLKAVLRRYRVQKGDFVPGTLGKDRYQVQITVFVPGTFTRQCHKALIESPPMNPSLLITATFLLYGLATLFQYLDLKGNQQRFKLWISVFAVTALVLHAWLLHHWIDVRGGQNLSFFNMLSLSCWLIALLLVLLNWLRSLEVLCLLIFPLAALSVLAAYLFPGFELINTAASPAILIHVVLAVLSFGVLCIAGLQAVLLILVERVLKARHWGFQWRMPPVQSMERFLFQSIWLGFILLSLVLISSVYSYHRELLLGGALLQKTLLASLAWVVFAMLLLGHRVWGWRGRRVTLGTLGGILILVGAYVGTKFIWKI